jgi:hypothetical protein
VQCTWCSACGAVQLSGGCDAHSAVAAWVVRCTLCSAGGGVLVVQFMLCGACCAVQRDVVQLVSGSGADGVHILLVCVATHFCYYVCSF